MTSIFRGPGVTRLTPPGPGGVAVLRVVGEESILVLREAFSSTLPSPGCIAYGVLASADADAGVLDEVLVVEASSALRSSPEVAQLREHAFEVHVHGSPFLVAEIIRRLGSSGSSKCGAHSPGAALASSHFRERAAALVHLAPSALGARILLDQASGAMDRALGVIAGLPAEERAPALAVLAQRGRMRERLFRDSTVALVGPVNAGKSTLFNALVGADAASVSSEAGTTRDALSERARLGPWPVRFLDTAGERDLAVAASQGDARALVEQEGQRIAVDLAGRADLVVRLLPAAVGKPAAGVSVGLAPSAPVPVSPMSLPREVVLRTQAAAVFGPDPVAWPPAALGALEHPAHARGIVEAAFATVLGLSDPDALWEGGQAVPFDNRSISALERVSNLGDVSDRTLDELPEHL